MAGITTSPQLRESPETAKCQPSPVSFSLSLPGGSARETRCAIKKNNPRVEDSSHRDFFSLVMANFARLLDRADGFAQLRVKRKGVSQFVHLAADPRQRLRVLALIQRSGDPRPHLHHLSFFHAARGQRRSTDADAA